MKSKSANLKGRHKNKQLSHQINTNLNVMVFSLVKNWTRLIRGQVEVSGHSRQDQGSKPQVLMRIAQKTAALARLKTIWNDYA